MLKTYNTLKNILGEAEARSIVNILINNFNFYITTEEMQIIQPNKKEARA